MKKPIVIEAAHITKTFQVPHENTNSVKEHVFSGFRKNEYEEFKALQDVSISVQKGEFLGIIGHNGSGKSTLLKILAGIYTPDEGKVTVTESLVPFLELGVGFNPELSGRDNIYLNATILGLSKKQIDERIDAIIEFSEIGQFIEQKLKNYSSGMYVRLAFSVAIHAGKEILLMDEVLAVGDMHFQSKCLRHFTNLKKQGKTVVFVAHDINAIQRYCDRVVLLDKGIVVAEGDPMQVCNTYIELSMSEEERQIRALTKKANGEKKNAQEKPIHIGAVDILTDNGATKEIVHTGDNITIRVEVKKQITVEKLNVGIGMYTAEGVYLFSYNTQVDAYEEQGDYVLLHINNFPLLKGEYYLNVVCFGEVEGENYDFKGEVKRFSVFSTGKDSMRRGLLSLPHHWSVTDEQ